MAGLALPPGFSTNSWAEDTWAQAMASQLPAFRAVDAAAWKPTPASGLDRTVQLAAGGGWAYGVWDRTAAPENAPQHPQNSTGSDRYDFVVSRWNWTTHTRTFEVIVGTTVPPAINSTQILAAAKANRIPNVRYDAIVALVRVRPGVGAFSGTDITDTRVWGSQRLQALTSQVLPYVDTDAVQLASDGAIYMRDGTAWLAFDTRLQTYTPDITTSLNRPYFLVYMGNGTNTGRYWRRGRMVDLAISFRIGSTTDFTGAGASVIRWDYPPGLRPGDGHYLNGVTRPGGRVYANTSVGDRLIDVLHEFTVDPVARRMYLSNDLQQTVQAGASAYINMEAVNRFAVFDTCYEIA